MIGRFLAGEFCGDFDGFSVAQEGDYDFLADGFFTADEVAPEYGAVVGVIVVAAAVDTMAICGEDDIALFDACQIGSSSGEDFADVDAALFRGEF